ncbi:MAG: TonB-dependent receptor [Parvularculaceae bacterium]|nr:TonB-dependent receptor [Parvularculaceae bacterium]
MRMKNAFVFGAGALAFAPCAPALAQIEEVLVTAQKWRQSIDEIGFSVSAFEGEDAARFGADIEALAGQIPGVESYAAGTYVASFFIRGVGLNEFAGNFNAPVAVHYDEVYVSKSWQTARPVFDVSRIEVLKGPQGTLFGRNTTGGAVNYYFNEPGDRFEGYAVARADQHERYGVEGAAGGPLGSGFAARFAFSSRFGTGGPQFNLFDGEEHGRPDVHQFRGQIKWTGAQTTVKATVQGGVDRSELAAYKAPGVFSGTGFCPQALSGAVSFAPATCLKFNGVAALNGRPDLEREPADLNVVNQNRPPRKHDHFYGGSLRIERKLGAATLTSLTSYDRYSRDQQEDSDGTPVKSIDVDVFNTIDAFTQEARLSGTAARGRLNYVVGGFFEHDDLSEVDSLNASENPFNLPPSSIGLPPRLVGIFDQSVRSYALFANAEYAIDPRWTLVAGMRLTRETSVIVAETNVGLDDVSGDRDIPATLFVAGGIDSVDATTSPSNPSLGGVTSNRHRDDDLSWKVGLNFKPDARSLLYVVAQTGFRTGGYSVAIGGPILEFAPEDVLSIEAGAKLRFAGDRGRATLAAWRARTRNSQINVDDAVSPLVPITRNIPKLVNAGVEGEVELAPVRGLNAAFGASFMHSEVVDSSGAVVTSFGVGPVPIKGARAINAPKWSANGRVSYERPLSNGFSLSIGADARWVAARYYEITNRPVDRAPSYFAADARIALAAASGWEVSLFASNLFDAEYITYINNLPGVGFKIDIFGERRTVGAMLRARF